MACFYVLIISTPADFHNHAQNSYGIGLPLLPDKVVFYIDSLAKKAVAFFKISCSMRSRLFSFRNRFSSSFSVVIWPLPGNAWSLSPANWFLHLHNIFCESVYIQILPASPFCSRNVPEPGGNQHQSGLSIRECPNDPCPASYFPHESFQGIVRTQRAPMLTGESHNNSMSLWPLPLRSWRHWLASCS